MDYSPTKEHPSSNLHVHVTTTMTTKETPFPDANNTRRSTHIISGVWADSVVKDGDATGVQTTIGVAAQKRDVKIRHRILLFSIVFVTSALIAGVIAVIASQHHGKASGEPATSSALSAVSASEADSAHKTTTSDKHHVTHIPPLSFLPTRAALTNVDILTSSLVVTALTTMSTYTIVITPPSSSASEAASSMGISTGQVVNGTFSSSEMSTGL